MELDEEGRFDFTQDFTTFLKAIRVFDGYSSVTKTVLFLRGSKAQKLQPRFYTNPLYGSGKNKVEQWWKLVADLMIREDYLKTVSVSRDKPSITSTKMTNKGERLLEQVKTILLHPLQDMMKFFTRKIDPKQEKVAVSVEPLFTFGAIPGKSSQTPQTSQATGMNSNLTVCAPKMKFDALMKDLLLERSKIASDVDCMPYVIASTKALEQMCRLMPQTLEELRQGNIDGFSEVKIDKFGPRLVKFFRKVAGVTAKPSGKNSMETILERHPLVGPLKGSAAVTYDLFVEGFSLAQICTKRDLAESTIVSHIKTAIECGKKVTRKDLERFDVNHGTFEEVKRNLPPDLSSVKLTPIKEACDPGISFNNIILVLAYFRVRQHLERIGQPYEDPDRPDVSIQKTEETQESQEIQETQEDIEIDVDLEMFDSIEQDILLHADQLDQESQPSHQSSQASQGKKTKYAPVAYMSDDSDDEGQRKENLIPTQVISTPSPLKKRRQNLIL